MVRLGLLCLILSFSLSGFCRSFSISDCEKAAQDGVFLSQIELANLFFNGISSVLGQANKDMSLAKYYSLLAVYNENAKGVETKKLKALEMWRLAEISLLEVEVSNKSEDADDAFFWAYAALRNGLDKTMCPNYNKIVETAKNGLSQFAKFDDFFLDEYLYLCNELTTPQSNNDDPIYNKAIKKGISPSNSLSLKLMRKTDGSIKYIGQTREGKANGFGIYIGQRNVYFGQYFDGNIKGQGILFIRESGKIMKGEWSDNSLQEGNIFLKDDYLEPYSTYKNGKIVYGEVIRLNFGEEDKNGQIIPLPVIMNSSVRWASNLMGIDKNKSIADIYRWGSTNKNHKYQSKDPTASDYLPRNACLAIYGGANRNSDICGTGYDAPYYNWGKAWRMPTKEELSGLIDNSIVEFDGNGNVVIAGKDFLFPNTISFTLPKGTDGYGIWTGNIDPLDEEKAIALIFDLQNHSYSFASKDRESAYAILPVTELPYLYQDY